MNWTWIAWTVLGLILIVAEVFTSGFVLLWFGLGALAAALAGLVGIDSLALQFLIFAGVSIGLTAASRTIFVNYFSRRRQVIHCVPASTRCRERLALSSRQAVAQ